MRQPTKTKSHGRHGKHAFDNEWHDADGGEIVIVDVGYFVWKDHLLLVSSASCPSYHVVYCVEVTVE